jgi:L-methionine (R)-S-oxide reductase
MHEIKPIAGLPKPEAYRGLHAQLAAVLAGERDGLANTANMAALLYQALPVLNWAGFYFLRDGGLVLGPFQGKVACIRIPLGKGVCGTAAAKRETIVVPDVEKFPGHIACDHASRARRSSCRCSRMAACSACWISTARISHASMPTMPPGCRPW